MKQLQIFKENNDYVLRRINQFGAVFERRFSKNGLIEAIGQYKTAGELHKYQVQASDDILTLIGLQGVC